jgi:hypothetical protein
MKNTTTLRRLLLLPAIAALVALTGCASQLTHQELTPAPVQLAKHHAQSVSVTVLGKADVDAEKAKPATDEMRLALVDAIKESKAFAYVAKDGVDYQLTVQLFNESHPAFGFAFTSQLEMGWTLKRSDTGAVVWQAAIKTEHTTGATEAFSGAERVKMAIVGAIKKNYVEGLNRIGGLSL